MTIDVHCNVHRLTISKLGSYQRKGKEKKQQAKESACVCVAHLRLRARTHTDSHLIGFVLFVSSCKLSERATNSLLTFDTQ